MPYRWGREWDLEKIAIREEKIRTKIRTIFIPTFSGFPPFAPYKACEIISDFVLNLLSHIIVQIQFHSFHNATSAQKNVVFAIPFPARIFSIITCRQRRVGLVIPAPSEPRAHPSAGMVPPGPSWPPASLLCVCSMWSILLGPRSSTAPMKAAAAPPPRSIRRHPAFLFSGLFPLLRGLGLGGGRGE